MFTVKDLLFPRRCPVCDRPVKPAGALICAPCKTQLKYVKEPACLKCGKALRHAQQEYCFDCMHKKHEYDRGVSLYRYGSIRECVYRFKYGGRQEYAEFLGKELAEHLGRQIREWNPDAVIPVPLHPDRLRRRGYNQAELLALELGKRLQLPVLTDWLCRTKNTVPQKLLDGRARQNNLKKAFKIGRNDVKLKTIVIIDDIYTTGSTIDEIALTCRAYGVRKIYFAALSIGNGMG